MKDGRDIEEYFILHKSYKLGWAVWLMRGLERMSPDYKDLIGTRYYRKCPDLLIDGQYYEYESYIAPWTKKKVSHMLSSGMKQSSRLIINNNKGASDRHVRKLIQARLHLNAPLNEVWLYEKGKVRLIYKKQQGG